MARQQKQKTYGKYEMKEMARSVFKRADYKLRQYKLPDNVETLCFAAHYWNHMNCKYDLASEFIDADFWDMSGHEECVCLLKHGYPPEFVTLLYKFLIEPDSGGKTLLEKLHREFGNQSNNAQFLNSTWLRDRLTKLGIPTEIKPKPSAEIIKLDSGLRTSWESEVRGTGVVEFTGKPHPGRSTRLRRQEFRFLLKAKAEALHQKGDKPI